MISNEEKEKLSFYYGLFQYIETGHVERETLLEQIKNITKILTKKYGEDSKIIKFLKKCILAQETGELSYTNKDWIRTILHNEVYPDEQHTRVLDFRLSDKYKEEWKD